MDPDTVLISEMRVAQLTPLVRVPPHWPKGVNSYCANVHVCAMYSDAIQIELPSTAAAP